MFFIKHMTHCCQIVDVFTKSVVNTFLIHKKYKLSSEFGVENQNISFV